MTPAQLEQAKGAYHLLVTGQSPRAVTDQNGEKVEWNAANADRLLAYIRIFDPTYLVAAQPITDRISRPLGFVF